MSTTTAVWTQTADADFNAGTHSGTWSASGTMALQKPLGVFCSQNGECASGWCRNGTECAACEAFAYGSSTYETVVIGTQCWMASNLNIGVYATSTDTGLSHSDVSDNSIIEKYCYNNTPSLCDTEGGLYDWDEAMGYVEIAGTQGICPSGWHIPTDTEWYTLENYLKDDGQTCSASRSGAWDCATAGAKLKTGGSSGFTAFLAGSRSYTGYFNNRGSDANFWSSSVSGSYAWYRYLNSSESRVYRVSYGQTSGFSVRCLKD